MIGRSAMQAVNLGPGESQRVVQTVALRDARVVVAGGTLFISGGCGDPVGGER